MSQKKKKIVWRDDNEEELRKQLLRNIQFEDMMENQRNGKKPNETTSTYKRAPPKRVQGHVDPPLRSFNYAESVVTTKKQPIKKAEPKRKSRMPKRRKVILGSRSYNGDQGSVNKEKMKETHRLKGCSKSRGTCKLYAASSSGGPKRLRSARHKTYVGSKGGIYILSNGKKRYLNKKDDIYHY